MSRPLRSVIFDWDGTLVDTAEPTFRAYVKTFADFGIAFDRDTYARTYSPNWYHTFRQLDLPESVWADADARWLAHFAEESSALHDETVAVLDRLEGAGVVCGIVTSGGRSRVSSELASFGLSARFAELVFGDDAQNRKPHPEALELCLTRLGISAGDAAYVGDSPEDVQMARAAGVFSVAVPGGYPNLHLLEAAVPDLFASSLSSAIEALLERQFE